MQKREVVEGMQSQGSGEAIPYGLDVTRWGSNPTSPQLQVWESTGADWIDRTATVVPFGTATVNGNVIALPLIRNLTVGHTYRAIVTFVIGDSTLSAYFDIKAEK